MANRILFLETPDIAKTPVGEEPTAGSVSSVNGKTGAVTLSASDVGALPSGTPIPPAVTEQTVAGWGFTKNTGDYSKPSGGIPKSDLASDVQASLGKADTAIQQHQDISGKVDKVTGKGLSTNDYTTAEKNKLAGIEVGAQVNVITGVSVNGMGLTPQDGVVDVPVPTDYVTSAAFDDRTGQMLITLSLTNGIIALEQSGTPLSVLISIFMNNCNAWFVLPTAYITGIPSNTDMMRFWMTGVNMDKSAPTVSLTSEYGGKVYHAVLSPVSKYRMEGQLQVLDYQTATQVQTAISGVRQLPAVTASDNGKFLRVVSGAWAAATIPAAESNSFGGGS